MRIAIPRPGELIVEIGFVLIASSRFVVSCCEAQSRPDVLPKVKGKRDDHEQGQPTADRVRDGPSLLNAPASNQITATPANANCGKIVLAVLDAVWYASRAPPSFI